MTQNTELTRTEPQEVAVCESRPVYRPRVEVRENNEFLTLLVEMPGVGENQVDVTLDKNLLTVRGNIEPVAHEGFEADWSEYRDGNYERTFKLHTEIDRDNLQARMKDGILTIQLPKSAKAGETKIKVVAG